MCTGNYSYSARPRPDMSTLLTKISSPHLTTCSGTDGIDRKTTLNVAAVVAPSRFPRNSMPRMRRWQAAEVVSRMQEIQARGVGIHVL